MAHLLSPSQQLQRLAAEFIAFDDQEPDELAQICVNDADKRHASIDNLREALAIHQDRTADDFVGDLIGILDGMDLSPSDWARLARSADKRVVS